MGVRTLSIFGSVARDQAGPGSDVDFLVEFDQPVGYLAASRVSVEDQSRAPEVPWRKMRGMRNIAVHEYFGLDAETLWITATQDVPAPTPLLRALVATTRT